jgi:hypothetical protein
VIAVATQQTLVPSTACFHIGYGDERLRTHGIQRSNFSLTACISRWAIIKPAFACPSQAAYLPLIKVTTALSPANNSSVVPDMR